VALVGEFTGVAELAVTDTGARSAIALVDAVLAPGGSGVVAPGDGRSLAVADRDRILVQIYLEMYGPVVDSTLTCGTCRSRFDLDFRLDELAAHCDPDPDDEAPPWRVGDIEFRPLTGADELAVLGDADPDAALFRRVVVGERDDADRSAVADELASRTPPVSAPIGAICPECDEEQQVDFDVQRYLLARLLGERRRTLGAFHSIAATYHWSRQEIVALTRDEREVYVEMIGAAVRAR
jgi:hypothetical protein